MRQAEIIITNLRKNKSLDKTFVYKYNESGHSFECARIVLGAGIRWIIDKLIPEV